MAINQQFLASPGKTIGVRIEQPAEPGQPRLFWDGKAFGPDAGARTLAFEDPGLPGVYVVWVPTASTKTWPDKVYYLAAVADGAAVAHWPVYMPGGNDGSLPTATVDYTLADGRRLHLWGAYAK